MFEEVIFVFIGSDFIKVFLFYSSESVLSVVFKSIFDYLIIEIFESFFFFDIVGNFILFEKVENELDIIEKIVLSEFSEGN